MSRPRNRTWPSRLAPSGSSPIRPRPRVDLPHPDSPTRPRVSPGARSKLTPSTARMAPRVVPYQTRTSRAEITGPPASGAMSFSVRSMAMSALLLLDRRRLVARRHDDRKQPTPSQGRVERLVQAFTHEGQPDHQEHDREAGVQTGPPDPGAGIGQRTVQVVPPLGRVGRLDAEPEEAEAGEGEDGVGGVQRAQHRHAVDDIAEQVLAHDAAVSGADGAGGLDVRRLLGAERRVAD